MKNIKATEGDKKLYSIIKDGEVRALRGNTSAGDGWRPICRGRYLGGACVSSESEAIKQGKKFVSELRARVEGVEVKNRKSNKSDKKSGSKNGGI